MERALIGRLEAAVSRLEALSVGAQPSIAPRGLSEDASARDPAILAFDDLVAGALGRVSAAAGKIGAEVAEVTRLVEKAFLVGIWEGPSYQDQANTGESPTWKKNKKSYCLRIGDSFIVDLINCARMRACMIDLVETNNGVLGGLYGASECNDLGGQCTG